VRNAAGRSARDDGATYAIDGHKKLQHPHRKGLAPTQVIVVLMEIFDQQPFGLAIHLRTYSGQGQAARPGHLPLAGQPTPSPEGLAEARTRRS
jgi:hypothetical protein